MSYEKVRLLYYFLTTFNISSFSLFLLDKSSSGFTFLMRSGNAGFYGAFSVLEVFPRGVALLEFF
jgi:hypothetical protein